MRQTKLFEAENIKEAEKLLNEFYAEAGQKGYYIITTRILSPRDPAIVQVVFDIDESGGKR